MNTYNFLPGVIVDQIDNQLTSVFAPSDDAVLVLGTSGDGVIDTPYQVTDTTAASNEFGLAGSLFRGCAEAALYSDNVIAYRIGTKAMTLSNVGEDSTSGAATPGFNLAFGGVTADAASRYTLWYNAGVLAVYKDGEIQFSNQPNAAVDTGDITITALSGLRNAAAVAGNEGLTIGTGATPSVTGAISVAAAAALAGNVHQVAPTLGNPVDGTSLTKRQIFVAIRQAFDLLQGTQVKVVYAPDAILDNPNVAFYVASDATTVLNNPVTNPNALDWFRITQDPYGDNIYQWASETIDSTGATVPAMSAESASSRVAAGFNEVNFAHTLASFAADVSNIGPKCIAVIGTSAPSSASLRDTRTWVGFLPVYDTNNHPVKSGSGLLGSPYMNGTTSTKLNPLCSDYVNGYRLPGFYVTGNDTYDGTIDEDINGNPVDAGSFMHIFADFGIITSAYGTNYLNNAAGEVAGYLSQLDSASGLTNKAIRIGQVWTPQPAQLDALTKSKISILRSGGRNQNPTLLHDLTAATDASDYTNLVRVRCMGVAIQTMLNRANKYLGESTLDGLTLVSMQAQLTQDLTNLQSRGYITRPSVKVVSSPAQQRIGHATLYLTCRPADELIQLTAQVAIGQ